MSCKALVQSAALSATRFPAAAPGKALVKISPSKNTLFSLYQRGQEDEKL